MYICVCHAVTDSAIKKAVADGVHSLRDLSMETGCSTQCGSCVKLAREVLDQALEEQGFAQSRAQLNVVRNS